MFTRRCAEHGGVRPLALGALAMVAGALTGLLVYRWSAPEAPAPEVHTVAPARSAEGVPERRPDFVLSDLDGVAQDVGQWDGRVLVLNFWATWCAPCRHEIPFFIDVQRRYAAQGLQVVGIAIDTPQNVKPYYEALGMNYPTLLGQVDAIRVGEAYGNVVGGLPYTVFVTREGRIAEVRSGPIELEELEATVGGLL